MQLCKSFVLLVIATMGVSSYAVRPDMVTSSTETAPTNQVPSSPTALGWDGIYTVPADAQIRAREIITGGRVSALGEHEKVSLFRDEKVAVEFKGAQALLHFAPDAAGERQSLVMSRDELNEIGLKVSGRGSKEDLKASQTQIAGRMILKNSENRVIAQGCLAYVLNALGLRPKGGVGGANRMTAYLVREKGWSRASCGRPVDGMVASWSAKQHTAIYRSGRGWCYDQGCHDPGADYGTPNCAVSNRAYASN